MTTPPRSRPEVPFTWPNASATYDFAAARAGLRRIGAATRVRAHVSKSRPGVMQPVAPSDVHIMNTSRSEGVLPVKLLELPIDVWQVLAQRCRALEKLLTRNRKELGRACKTVRIDRQIDPIALLILQAIPRA